ncbi:hypothetical protein F7725_006794 [Dissostichus mawsoni]|uniref:Uncharacterized protein n=1 Tax=Dissostichus mawsoni TaxID=36200 RepID=A0A7J5XUZ4_DISMA|nr:hypothetical protein F7725_006794 [Dissostichus mawsoni]
MLDDVIEVREQIVLFLKVQQISCAGVKEAERDAIDKESGKAEAESSLCREEISVISCSLRSVSRLSLLTVLCSRPSPCPVGLLSSVLSNRKITPLGLILTLNKRISSETQLAPPPPLPSYLPSSVTHHHSLPIPALEELEKGQHGRKVKEKLNEKMKKTERKEERDSKKMLAGESVMSALCWISRTLKCLA